MISKEKIIFMEDQIKIGSVHRDSSLFLSRILEIMTDQGNILSLNSRMDIEFVQSEDGSNYIEYEYDDNKVINTVKKVLNLYQAKLYFTDDLMKLIDFFQLDLNVDITLEGYIIEVTKKEGIMEDCIKAKARKQLFVDPILDNINNQKV